MLLTGFDAPIEQVMYIDRPLKEHTLLQAIARVNRTCIREVEVTLESGKTTKENEEKVANALKVEILKELFDKVF